jgi:hypothetical protein
MHWRDDETDDSLNPLTLALLTIVICIFAVAIYRLVA